MKIALNISYMIKGKRFYKLLSITKIVDSATDLLSIMFQNTMKWQDFVWLLKRQKFNVLTLKKPRSIQKILGYCLVFNNQLILKKSKCVLESYLEPCQSSTTKLLLQKYLMTPLTIFVKKSVIDYLTWF